MFKYLLKKKNLIQFYLIKNNNLFNHVSENILKLYVVKQRIYL